MHFAKRRGEFALRLAMHASVPQGFQPELLHLLKRNFVPEAGDDPTIEADILFSPLCEELGRGFFSFDPQVRSLLLENLATNYAAEPESRIAKVADFLLAYVDHYDRSTSGAQDQLWRDYLEMQRWVAFAFVDPASAAQQLAAALENANASDDFVARIQLGGLASALAAPLARFPSLLNYAAGLQALELGDRERADELFESLEGEEIQVGNVTLRSASQVLNEWQSRHPEYVATPESEATDTSLTVRELLSRLRSRNADIRRQAEHQLGFVNASEENVASLIDGLGDRSVAVRLACVNALAKIGTEAAFIGLAKALSNRSTGVREQALEWLKQHNQRLALIGGYFRQRRHVLSAIQQAVLHHGYLPVTSIELSDRSFSEIAKTAHFVIFDVELSSAFYLDSPRIQKLSIPVQLIRERQVDVSRMFHDLKRYFPLSELITYDDVAELRKVLDRTIPLLVSKTSPGKKLKPRTFEYDVFISYAFPDHNQVVVLSEHLKHRLTRLIGKRPKIFFDTPSTPFLANKERVSISEAIDKSAVFLVYLSHSYLESAGCRRELERITSSAALQSDGASRIIKVVKHPVSFEKQPLQLQQRSGFDFYEVDQSSGQVQPLMPGSKAPDYGSYGEKVEELAWQVMRALVNAGVRHVESTQSASEQTFIPVQVLLLYTHKDARFRDDLMASLIPLERQGLIMFYEERIITPGTEWAAEMNKRLASTQLILLLISPDFLASDYVWSNELKHILRRAKAGEILVIPIIVRAADWHNSPYGMFRPLPSNEVPVHAWTSRDEAYVDIAQGIQTAVEAFNLRRQERPRSEPDTAQTKQKASATNRWPVRTGTDNDVGKVDPTQITTTVEALIALPRPRDLLLSGKVRRYQSLRAEFVETTTWLVDAHVSAFRRTQDGTYRLILRGESGATMLAQVPDPKFVDPSSPWRDSFIAVRMKLERELEFSGAYKYLEPPTPAQLIGIGYFGRPHGQAGAARNGIELHPIIAFEWMLDEDPYLSHDPPKTLAAGS